MDVFGESQLLALFRQVVREELGEIAPSAAAVVTFKEAARRLAVSERTLRRMIKRGEILTVRVSDSPRVPLSELRRVATPAQSSPSPVRPKVSAPVARAAARKRSTLDAELAKLDAGIARRRRR